MENRTSSALFLFSTFLIILSCSITAESSGKNQIESLTSLYNDKLKNNNGIDKSQFNASSHGVHKVNIHPQDGMKEKDKIHRLPGQPPVKFNQYAGYVTVNRTAGTAFFYYFAEAQRSDYKSLPLLLWLNGGPGCSSLAYGAMQELGPFRINSDGKTLYKNRYSWNHAANVLFVESPAGVGFSYSNTTADYAIGGDRKTANYNYAFLVNWLERFPEYKDRDFYISGESYAGHYVPQLAHTILHHNRLANRTIINLKGILIGNAVINDYTDTKGMYEYFASHALISDETWETMDKYCNFSSNDQTKECMDAANSASRDVNDIDIYNIYAPLCHDTNLTHKPNNPLAGTLDPCSDYYTVAYLNSPDVQHALHANLTQIPYEWQPCSDVIRRWQDSPSTVLPLLQEFMANGLRVWVFSGDIDGRIPVTSTKNSLKHLKLPIKTPWHPWHLDGEVGGYTQVYKGDMTFATVRGAGHQVPSYQPARALSLIMHFLGGTVLPVSSPKSRINI